MSSWIPKSCLAEAAVERLVATSRPADDLADDPLSSGTTTLLRHVRQAGFGFGFWLLSSCTITFEPPAHRVVSGDLAASSMGLASREAWYASMVPPERPRARHRSGQPGRPRLTISEGLSKLPPLSLDVANAPNPLIAPALGPIAVKGDQPTRVAMAMPTWSSSQRLPSPPAPREPRRELRIAWMPSLKPAPPAPRATIAAAVWPSPSKPIRPAIWMANAGGDQPTTPPRVPEPDAIVVAHGARPSRSLDQAIAVTDRTPDRRAADGAARTALQSGRPEEALQMYDDVLTGSPAQRTALLGRATALRHLDRKNEAEAAYRHFLQRYPGDLSAQIALLGLVGERAPHDAVRQLSRLARRHPGDSRLPAQIGLLLAQEGHFDRAVVQLRQALALAPTNPRYHTSLGALYDRGGRIDLALDHYRIALAMAGRTNERSLPLDAIKSRVRHLKGTEARSLLPSGTGSHGGRLN